MRFFSPSFQGRTSRDGRLATRLPGVRSASTSPCPNAIELSNNIIEKGVAFGREWSGAALQPDCAPALRKATAWPQHSVRGFLAGVVRQRLTPTLGSQKVDGVRVYQIAGVESSKHRPRKSERQSS